MRPPRPTLSIALLSLSFVSVQATADDESSEPVVVSATRVPTPESQIASSVTLITAEDIARKQEQTLPQVLKDVPGLNLVQSGGPGSLTSVFMRGTNANHTKVFIDGIDVSDPSNSNTNFDFGQLLTQDISRVEVLRGPQSGLYGSDAIGGVINIVTREGNGPARLTGSLSGGSFGTFNQTAGVSGSSSALHYSAGLEHYHSSSTPVTPLGLLLPGEERHDDYYDNVTASTKLGYDLGRDLDFGLVARYTQTYLRFTGDDFSAFPNPSFPASRQSESGIGEYYGRVFGHLVMLDGLLDQTLGLAYTRNRSANYEPDAPVTLDTGERTKIDWQGILKIAPTQTVVLGAEHSRDDISQPLSAAIKVDAGYAELQSQLGDDFFSALNVRYDDNSRFGSKVTYRVAPTYLIRATGTRLKASVGTGFKAPTLSELYQSFPAFFFFANPDLKPETSLGYDIGIEQRTSDEKISAGATYFHIRLRDLITTAFTATGTTYGNVGRATTEGVESFVNYEPFKELSLRADYTYTQAADDILNQELLRRPKHKASLNASWQALPALSLNATLLMVGSWVDGNRDFSIPRLAAPSYTTLNIAGSYAVTPRIGVFARVDNLLDRRYENPVGFLQPSLGAFAGVKLTL